MTRIEDASHFRSEVETVLFPETEQEIAALLRKFSAQKKPVTICGGRTGLTGGCVPERGAALATEKLNRILSINWDDSRRIGSAVVQPGVSLKQLEEALEPRGLFYPPDPGEKAAFIGGTVSTNASGPRSLKYGATRRWVRRLRLILPQGDLLEISRGQIHAQGRTLALSLPGGNRITADLPDLKMPETKNSAGYFSQPDMDLIDLLIGAEGTLGVITEIEVEILKKPEACLSGILFFGSEWDCFSFAQEARKMKPRVLEFFDSRSLVFLARKYADLPSSAGAALYFQQECRAAETDRLREEWLHRSEPFRAQPAGGRFSLPAQDPQLLRQLRYDLPVLVNEQSARHRFRKTGTDLAVPARHAEEMFRFYLTELPRSGVEFALWGHLGDHHLHANFLPKTQEEFDRSLALYAAMAQKVVEFEGTVSAEHGIGKSRIPYLERMIGPEGMRQMARLKKAFDPDGILNPGNIFPAELLDHV